MHSFTSNSNSRLPTEHWIKTWIIVLFIVTTTVFSWEIYCRFIGFQPDGVADTADLWVKIRKKAVLLGKDAVILVGASRIQLGINTEAMSYYSPSHPTQLAIDGSYFLPILTNLANDPKITGTVIVDLEVDKLNPTLTNGYAEELVNYYEWSKVHSNASFYQIIEDDLRTKFDGLFAFRTIGANPKTLFLRNLIGSAYANTNYLTTLPDRSRKADYKLVSQVNIYQSRLQRNLGAETLTSLHTVNWPEFNQYVINLQNLVEKIQKRGGRVIFVRFPTDKGIWQIDETRFPRHLFWDAMAKNTTAETIHFKDYPELSKYNLPDGSHLDYRDAIPFTKFLSQLIFKKDK